MKLDIGVKNILSFFSLLSNKVFYRWETFYNTKQEKLFNRS